MVNILEKKFFFMPQTDTFLKKGKFGLECVDSISVGNPIDLCFPLTGAQIPLQSHIGTIDIEYRSIDPHDRYYPSS